MDFDLIILFALWAYSAKWAFISGALIYGALQSSPRLTPKRAMTVVWALSAVALVVFALRENVNEVFYDPSGWMFGIIVAIEINLGSLLVRGFIRIRDRKAQRG